MSRLTIERLNALPQVLKPSTIYIIASTTSGIAEMYFSDSSGQYVRKLIGETEVIDIVNRYSAQSGSMHVVVDIPTRNQLQLTNNALVYVLDATLDPAVASGGAFYFYDVARATYVRTSQIQMSNTPLTWNNIAGRPGSTPAQIDQAVSMAHAHANKNVLDNFSTDTLGNLQYNSNGVPQVTISQW